LTIALAIFTSASWKQATVPILNDVARLRRLCAITTGLIYLQIVFGAVLRHTGERLDAHLVLAALVAIHVILVILRVRRHHGDIGLLNRPALTLLVLLLAQVGLGGASYAVKFTTLWPVSFDAIVLITTVHLAVGALMLAASVALTLRAYRFSAPTEHGRRQEILAEQFSV
jgi:cytochrome c oxidase assembly protein subunit 15